MIKFKNKLLKFFTATCNTGDDRAALLEACYRNSFQEASDGICLADAETGVILECNLALARMVDRDPSELIGNHQKILHPPAKHGEQSPTTFKAHPAPEDGCTLAAQLITRSGNIKDVEIKSNVLKINDREVGQSFFRDVTDRKRNEASLCNALSNYKVLLENIPQTIFSKDIESKFVSCNAHYARYLKITPEEISGKTDYDFFPKAAAQKYRDDDKRIIASGATENNEEKFIKDGREIWLHTVKTPIRDDHDNITGILCIFWNITKRKQAQLKVEKQLKFLRTLLDTIPNPVFYKDADGRYTECNTAFNEFVGKTREEIIGKTVFDVSPEAIARQYNEKDTALFSHGGTQCYEWQAKRNDGQTRDVIFNKAALTDTDGNVDGLIGIISDVTELKRTEEKLRQREAKLHERERLLNFAIQQMPIPVIIARAPDAHITNINLSALKLMAKEPSDVQKISAEERRDYWPAFYPDGRPYRTEDLPLTRAIVNGEITRDVEIVVRKMDRDHIVSASSAPLYDDQGNIVAGIVAFPDITARNKAEQALRESERKYRELVENANSIILRMDGAGNITFFNEFAQQFFGYKEDEILGKNVLGTIVPPVESTGRSLTDMIADISQQPELYTYNENENMRRNGERVWITWTNKPIFDSRGKIRETLCIGKDITDQKHAEQAVENAKKKLERLYSRLVNSQEEERKRIALELHDDLGQSLVVLKLRLQTIKRELPGNQPALERKAEETLEYVSQIMEKIRRLSHNLTPGCVDDLGLTVSIKSLADEFARHADLDIHLDTAHIDNLFPSTAKVIIYRIFQEIFKNIEKHSQARSVTIKNVKRPESVTFMILDDGTGFDMESIETRDPSQKGLGLASMDERIRMLGGSFEIKSREGGGTKITFSVPFDPDQANPA